MLKIKIKGSEISLSNEHGRTLSFKMTDNALAEVIKKNIDRLGDDDGCVVSIEKKSERGNYLILNNHKLMVPALLLYEISSRMLLLNRHLKYPYIPEREEEQKG